MSEQAEGLSSARVTVILPHELADVVDRRAAASYSNRSEFVRVAIVERLRREGALPQLPSPAGPDVRL